MTKFELACMMGLSYCSRDDDEPMYSTFYYEFHYSNFSIDIHGYELSSLEGANIVQEALDMAHERAADAVFEAIGKVVKREHVLW